MDVIFQRVYLYHLENTLVCSQPPWNNMRKVIYTWIQLIPLFPLSLKIFLVFMFKNLFIHLVKNLSGKRKKTIHWIKMTSCDIPSNETSSFGFPEKILTEWKTTFSDPLEKILGLEIFIHRCVYMLLKWNLLCHLW